MMPPIPDDPSPPAVNLASVVREHRAELGSLLGPTIHLAIGNLNGDGVPWVRASRRDIVDLLRHLALDARDAMLAGGTVTIRTGCLREPAECGALIVHEAPSEQASHRGDPDTTLRKGRSLGYAASYEMIERAGGHFHVSCRGRETALTICFPLAD